MYPSHCACARQQRRVRHRAAHTDSYAFFNLLTGPRLLEQVEALLPAHRERLFPPTETLSMFLAQALSGDRSCQQAVNDAAVKRLVGGLPQCSTNTGTSCKARARLPLEMIARLSRHTGRLIAEGAPSMWHWQGRPVRLVDGATVAMPDTAANQAAYPQPASQKTGLGFPLCRIVALLCLGSGALLNVATSKCEGKGSDEQSLLRSQLDTLQPGDILVGDAFYATYFLLCELLARGVDGVFEQHGGAAPISAWARSWASATTSSCYPSQRARLDEPSRLRPSPRYLAGARAIYRPAARSWSPPSRARSAPPNPPSRRCIAGAGMWSWTCATSRPPWAWRC